MKNEISDFMKETTHFILELNKIVKNNEKRIDIIQESLEEMSKVSNKTLNESILKLTDMMNNE